MNRQATKIARPGCGSIQWELGWFIGVIGGTSWLAIGAIALAWQGQILGSAVSATSWLFVLTLACWLWTRRDRVDPFDAVALVLIELSVVMPIVWFACWDAPTDQRIPALHWVRGLRSAAASFFGTSGIVVFLRSRTDGTQNRTRP